MLAKDRIRYRYILTSCALLFYIYYHFYDFLVEYSSCSVVGAQHICKENVKSMLAHHRKCELKRAGDRSREKDEIEFWKMPRSKHLLCVLSAIDGFTKKQCPE